LAEAVHQISLKHPSVLLAGHFCIFNKNTEVDVLPEDVFSQLNIQKIILLEASEEVIINHLSKRDDKTYSVMQIVALKEAERSQAVKIASELKKSLIIHQMRFNDSDVDEIITKIKEC
jgi:adenylate kinase